MTLKEIIEEAKGALEHAQRWMGGQPVGHVIEYGCLREHLKDNIARLSVQPLTEAELEIKILSAWYDLRGLVVTDGDRARSVIRILRGSGMLYVEEADGKETPQG